MNLSNFEKENVLIMIVIALTIAFSATAQQAPETTETKAKTCTAITAAGKPCKGTILMKDGKCRSHSETTPKCGATTSKGTPCRMSVKVAGDKCKHHAKQ